MKIAIGAISAFALMATGCVWVRGVEVSEEVHFERPLASSAACVAIDNVVGDVHVEAWDRDQVRIVAEKQAHGSNDEDAREALSRIVVDVHPTDAGLSVETRLPHGSSSGGVSYHLTVPSWAKIDAHVVTGEVSIEGVTGGVRADVTTGSVELNGVSAPTNVKVVTGAIRATVTELEHPVSFQTTTGRVDVGLPKDKGARLDAETTVGSIACGYDLGVGRDSTVGARVSGAVNGGGPDVRVRVTTGEIRVAPRARSKA